MNTLAPILVTPPAVLPVTLAEVKGDMNILHDDDDARLQDFIEAAVSDLDGWRGSLGRCLINQTWAQRFDGFPAGDVIRLPMPDVSQATVTYFDAANTQQTLAGSSYSVVADDYGPFLQLADGLSWPDTFVRPDAVRVQFVAGYGAAAADVPAILRTAMIKHVRMMNGYEGGTGPGLPVYEAWTTKHRRHRL